MIHWFRSLEIRISFVLRSFLLTLKPATFVWHPWCLFPTEVQSLLPDEPLDGESWLNFKGTMWTDERRWYRGKNFFLEAKNTFVLLLMSLHMRLAWDHWNILNFFRFCCVFFDCSIELSSSFQDLCTPFCPMSLQIVAPNFHHFTMFPPISYDAWHLLEWFFVWFLVFPKPYHGLMAIRWSLLPLKHVIDARFKGSKHSA